MVEDDGDGEDKDDGKRKEQQIHYVINIYYNLSQFKAFTLGGYEG